MAEEKDYQRAMALEREANDARIRELEADVARKDTALAAADKMLAVFQDIGEALAVPIEWEYEGETIAVATDVAAAREAIAKLNEEAEGE